MLLQFIRSSEFLRLLSDSLTRYPALELFALYLEKFHFYFNTSSQDGPGSDSVNNNSGIIPPALLQLVLQLTGRVELRSLLEPTTPNGAQFCEFEALHRLRIEAGTEGAKEEDLERIICSITNIEIDSVKEPISKGPTNSSNLTPSTKSTSSTRAPSESPSKSPLTSSKKISDFAKMPQEELDKLVADFKKTHAEDSLSAGSAQPRPAVNPISGECSSEFKINLDNTGKSMRPKVLTDSQFEELLKLDREGAWKAVQKFDVEAEVLKKDLLESDAEDPNSNRRASINKRLVLILANILYPLLHTELQNSNDEDEKRLLDFAGVMKNIVTDIVSYFEDEVIETAIEDSDLDTSTTKSNQMMIVHFHLARLLFAYASYSPVEFESALNKKLFSWALLRFGNTVTERNLGFEVGLYALASNGLRS